MKRMQLLLHSPNVDDRRTQESSTENEKMADKTVVGILTDKALKEGKSGNYYEFRIKEKSEQYPKTYRFFPKDEESTKMCEAVHKEETVEATYWEKESTSSEGQTVTFKNILTIKRAEVQEEIVGSASSSKDSEAAKEQRIINAINDTMKVAVLVREQWKENFLNDEGLKNLPQEALVATLNSLLIQVFKKI